MNEVEKGKFAGKTSFFIRGKKKKEMSKYGYRFNQASEVKMKILNSVFKKKKRHYLFLE